MKLLSIVLLLSCAAFGQTAVTSSSWNGIETQQFLASCSLHNNDSVACVATDGISFSYQGAPFVKLTSTTPVGAVTSVNGKKPDATGNVSLSIVTSASTPNIVVPI